MALIKIERISRFQYPTITLEIKHHDRDNDGYPIATVYDVELDISIARDILRELTNAEYQLRINELKYDLHNERWSPEEEKEKRSLIAALENAIE